MPSKINTISLALCAALLCHGCAVFTTFQSPETLEPGAKQAYVGCAIWHDESITLLAPEAGLRLGLVEQLDIGARASVGGVFTVDAKVELLDGPITASFDLGITTTFQSSGDGNTLLSPMLITGNKEWYVAAKRIYELSPGSDDGAGTVLALGGYFGAKSRFNPEINVLLDDELADIAILPALAIWFEF